MTVKMEKQIKTLIPWKTNQPVTAGRIQKAISTIFSDFCIVRFWCKKSKKLILEKPDDCKLATFKNLN